MAETEPRASIEYVVLEKSASSISYPETPEGESRPGTLRPTWIQVGKQMASTPRGAITAYSRANGNKAGKFAAVPTRHWHEEETEVDMEPRLKFK